MAPGEAIVQCSDERQWLRFESPVRVVTAASVEQVMQALLTVEEAVRDHGLFACGFLSYEAAPAFDPALRVRSGGRIPLAWFGLYDRVSPFAFHDDLEADVPGMEWAASITEGDYTRAISRIKDYIRAGNTYQVNFTYRLNASFTGDPWRFFLHLARGGRRGYAAYIELDDLVVCSASPELFFRQEGETVISQPMKGTAARGRTLDEDRAAIEWLHRSEKNRAENLMIVDMIRNDLGRIAEIGSVGVRQLFEVQRFPTVLQMISTVTARSHASFSQVMAALFPCASITGAPKASTMGIIADLETTPRGLYTGCIGFMEPDQGGIRAQFSVAIRTATIDLKAGRAEYGVGGGVTWESDAKEEYQECGLKSQVLGPRPAAFSVLEALLWSPAEGCFLLERHLKRLHGSTEYFQIPMDENKVLRGLENLAAGFSPEAHKVRIALSLDGQLDLSAELLSAIARPAVQRVCLSRTPVDSSDVFLFHKTTRRLAFDWARAENPGCDDVIFWNTRGEITESCTANVVIDLDGTLVTPPVECGLLPGVFRGLLIDEGTIVERVISRAELRAARRIYLINSVRKWMECALE
jgi:para-aminobenzoate synthetase/4-amino-4-deoxychorismate lyase